MKKILSEKFKLKPSLILLSVPVLLVFYRYYCYPEALASFFPAQCGADFKACFSAHLFFFICSVLLLLFIPFLLIRFVLKERIEDYGLRKGDLKFGLTSFSILFPLIALTLIFPSSKIEQFRAEYPLYALAGKSFLLVLIYELAYGFYYIGWEFFFRGFILFGLKDNFGQENALLIQTIPSVLMHIGKPEGEIFASLFAGILFGILALRGRSIYYVFLLHWFIGMAMDLFILYL